MSTLLSDARKFSVRLCDTRETPLDAMIEFMIYCDKNSLRHLYLVAFSFVEKQIKMR